MGGPQTQSAAFSAPPSSYAAPPPAYAYVSVNAHATVVPPPTTSYTVRGGMYAAGSPPEQHDPPTPATTRAYCLALAVFLAFVTAYILCAVLVPWPNPYGTSTTVRPNTQLLLHESGRWIESLVAISAVRSGELITFASEPRLTQLLEWTDQFSFRPSYNAPVARHADLKAGSAVQYSWDYNGGCPIDFVVIRGAATATAYFNQQQVSPELTLRFTGSQPVPASFAVAADDTYYFIFSNPDLMCSPSRAGQATLDYAAVSYDLSGALETCYVTVTTCTLYLPYPDDRWYLLLAPTDTQADVVVYYYTFGRWWTYTLLYSGLFLGMTSCTGIMCKRAKRIQEEQRALMGLGEARALLR